MTRRIVDLSSEELAALAARAADDAVRNDLARGIPVTGLDPRTGKIATIYPDGHIEELDSRSNPRPGAKTRRKARVARVA